MFLLDEPSALMKKELPSILVLDVSHSLIIRNGTPQCYAHLHSLRSNLLEMEILLCGRRFSELRFARNGKRI